MFRDAQQQTQRHSDRHPRHPPPHPPRTRPDAITISRTLPAGQLGANTKAAKFPETLALADDSRGGVVVAVVDLTLGAQDKGAVLDDCVVRAEPRVASKSDLNASLS